MHMLAVVLMDSARTPQALHAIFSRLARGNDRQFHDDFLASGGSPTAVQRRIWLDDPSDLEKVTGRKLH